MKFITGIFAAMSAMLGRRRVKPPVEEKIELNNLYGRMGHDCASKSPVQLPDPVIERPRRFGGLCNFTLPFRRIRKAKAQRRKLTQRRNWPGWKRQKISDLL